MSDPSGQSSFIQPVLVFCGAAAVAVPLFRRLGLGAIIGYLVAGVAIGPYALGLFATPETITGVAEIGVVLLLFIVGLELKLSHLWSMRRDIFGLGLAQLAITGILVAAVAVAVGVPAKGAAVAGAALSLSATAIALQILNERGELQTPYGQRSFAVLLFQDLSIVPILAAVPLMANVVSADAGGLAERLANAGKAIGAIVALVLIGRYLLNPFFRVLASSGAREVLTAAALLVVLGAALLMEEAGFSMAMGAFVAGVLLAESNFRHQLEADIEPFRGLLLGLFFMSVGMSLDLRLVLEQAAVLALATAALVGGKIAIVSALARLSGSSWTDALRAGALLATAGEFAFVLLPLAGTLGVLSATHAQLLIAVAALSMLVAPLAAKLLDMILVRAGAARPLIDEDVEGDRNASDQSSVIVIGFGRFGQVVNQVLLAEAVDVTVIDLDVNRIRQATRFGFQVYYGDGTRLDVLHAAGTGRARVVCVCVDHAETATRIVELLHAEFPRVRTYVRAYDRVHAIELMHMQVDYQLRETFRSALSFGRATLEALGIDPERAAEVEEDVRKRDIARLVLQGEGGLLDGADLLHGATVTPEPLMAPKFKSKALTAETRDLIAMDGDGS
ncbi:monovalent cation:proton antiporter-2 (CPA2) family protein [Chelatococcus reniformis]|uniref:Potassium transporter TrkA n=1 Tax=Chelatococcus reniformis TaxID=1494448 RepID=A0A916UVW1_9HYPH|nr:monovalent cation:proton antiporter-2 (CPA2) family protein [Chelatococcus reniformis]GGC91034.1 potassium transporter TrkA [Chelatococcus reniformis]